MSGLGLASREFMTEFIELYRSFPCLWQVKCKEYSDRNKKDLAYEELVNKYREVEPSADRNLVVKKINSIRTVYRKELAKVNNSLKSGAGVDDIYKPKLWYFSLLHFINDQDTARKGRSTFEEDEDGSVKEESDIEEDVDLPQVDENASAVTPASGNQTKFMCAAKTSNSPTTFRIPLPKENKKRRLKEADEAFKTMREIEENSSLRDEFAIFGELVAHKLRKCSNCPRSVAIAQREINDILFNLEMEQYAMDTSANIQSNVSGGQFNCNEHYSLGDRSTSSSSSLVIDSVQTVE